MNKYSLLLLFSCLIVVSSDAAVYKGQKVFVKECVKCHTSGQAFVAEKDMRAWAKLMKKKGVKLAKLHLDDKKAEDSWEYFESSKYTKKTKHLKDFLIEYAQDSGNAPACD